MTGNNQETISPYAIGRASIDDYNCNKSTPQTAMHAHES